MLQPTISIGCLRNRKDYVRLLVRNRLEGLKFVQVVAELKVIFTLQTLQFWGNHLKVLIAEMPALWVQNRIWQTSSLLTQTQHPHPHPPKFEKVYCHQWQQDSWHCYIKSYNVFPSTSWLLWTIILMNCFTLIIMYLLWKVNCNRAAKSDWISSLI